MSETIHVTAWSFAQWERYLTGHARCVMIPKIVAPERPEKDDVLTMHFEDFVTTRFRVISMPREIEIMKHTGTAAITTRGLHKRYLIRRTGYVVSQVRFARDAPADTLPPGEWRSFWLAEVQLIPRVPEAPKVEPEPAIPPVPAKRGRGRPRKEK